MIRRVATLPACALALAAACGGAEGPRRAGPEAPAIASHVARFELPAPGVTGLSGLARDEAGLLWAVAERRHLAVRIGADRDLRVLPILGVPEALDIEGVAWLPGGGLALATESNEAGRTSDSLFLARLDGDAIRAEEERRLEYAIWPLAPRGNQGIEGLCRAGGTLVLAVETVVAHGAERLAPVALHDVATGRTTPLFVRLTTRTGKLSALSCAARAGGVIDVLAVERHFEVGRLIRFAVPAGATAEDAPLEPVLVADLGPLLRSSENYEGLVWDGARAFALVTDNDWTHVTGPNLLVTGQLTGPVPAPLLLR